MFDSLRNTIFIGSPIFLFNLIKAKIYRNQLQLEVTVICTDTLLYTIASILILRVKGGSKMVILITF